MTQARGPGARSPGRRANPTDETTAYDRLAGDFDRRRPLPDGVAAAIRAAVHARLPVRPRILDLGCGTGRIGWPFAGDAYIGVDLSLGMLRAFAARDLPHAPILARADGTRLPFQDASFDGVLLVQVLSGTPGWRDLLAEVRRVLTPEGLLFVGQSKAPDDGLDAQMKGRLADILAASNEYPYRRKSKEAALDWLDRHASHAAQIVARWPIARAPRHFIERHGAGARISALDDAVKTAAMARLAAWAETTFGSLDTPREELQAFELHIYRFHQKEMP